MAVTVALVVSAHGHPSPTVEERDGGVVAETTTAAHGVRGWLKDLRGKIHEHGKGCKHHVLGWVKNKLGLAKPSSTTETPATTAEDSEYNPVEHERDHAVHDHGDGMPELENGSDSATESGSSDLPSESGNDSSHWEPENYTPSAEYGGNNNSPSESGNDDFQPQRDGDRTNEIARDVTADDVTASTSENDSAIESLIDPRNDFGTRNTAV